MYSVYINRQLQDKIEDLKQSQDSLQQLLKINQEQHQQVQKKITVTRHQLHTTIKSDWDNLNPEQQNAYITQLLSNLKAKNKT
jgi:predicted Ser/Thr protein kinase